MKFRDTGKKFELKGDLLKMMTNNKHNKDLAKISDKKIMCGFGKKIHCDVKAPDKKSDRDRSFKRLPTSSGIMAFGIPTIFLPENPSELFDRLTLLLQENQSGNNSDKINDEIIAIVDKLLENKCIAKKQRKILQVKCLN